MDTEIKKSSETQDMIPLALAFDLDGTLAPSKSHLESDMAIAFAMLLEYIPMAVVSGASKRQFQTQFIDFLLSYAPDAIKSFHNLYIFPQNGASLEIFKDNKWQTQYEDVFSKIESAKIISALKQAQKKFNISDSLINTFRYGHKIENRGAQVTFSALGQKAPLILKEKWDPQQVIRKNIKAFLDPLLPEFDIKIGGATSIDITKKGINKAFAVNNFIKILNISKNDLIFFGDALFPDGNDEIVRETGVVCQKVSNPQDTILYLRDIIQKYEETSR